MLRIRVARGGQEESSDGSRPPGGRGVRALAQVLLVLCLVVAASLVGSPTQAAQQRPQATETPGTRVELPELRTRTSATYREPDGRRTTAFSAGSLHYRGRDGEWQRISTQLVPCVYKLSRSPGVSCDRF